MNRRDAVAPRRSGPCILRCGGRVAGFTLIEVVVAIFVVSLTVMALGPVMAGINRGTSYGQSMTIASGRVQEKIEELRNVPYANILDGSEVLSGPTMTRSWSVVDEPVVNALKEVDVIVTWTNREGVDQHVSVRTFIASRNPR
ncbi:MAG: prepilin-type N-terminal cleavage/methylation domain-containing protein [Gemmatimonadota bacterium]